MFIQYIFFQTDTSEMEKFEERTTPRLVEIISERYNVNLSEAFEILVKVKEKNGGVSSMELDASPTGLSWASKKCTIV